MPNIKSAEKRVKITKIRTMRNKMHTSALKTQLKKTEAAIANNAEDKDLQVKLAVKKIDQAVAKGILHKNTAARKKSAIVRKAAN